MDVTDFDYPVYFDSETQQYKFPDYTTDLDIVANPPYNYWVNNYPLSIESVDVLNGGEGFTQEPTLIVNGGDGTAKLKANIAFGQIQSVTVLNSGNGFTSLPTIDIISGGVGVGAILVPRMRNQKVRTFDSTIKFDRIEYSGEIQNWTASTLYRANDFFVYQNKIYLILTDFTSGVSFNTVTTTTLTNSITSTADSAVSGGILLNDASGFASAGYIKINNEIFSYTGKSVNLLTGITRATLDSSAETHDSGDTVTRINFRLAKPEDLNSAMKRTQYYYAPMSGMTINDVKELFAGVDYPGVRVQGVGDFYGPQISIYDIEQEGIGQTAETAIIQGSITDTTLTVTNISRGSLADGQYLVGDGIAPGTRIILTEFEGSVTGSVLTITRMIRGIVRLNQQLIGPGVSNTLIINSFGTGIGGVGTYNLSNTNNIPPGVLKLQGTGFGQTGTYTVNISQTVAQTTIQATLPDVTDIDVYYQSSFLDTSLGIKSEDINVDGGKFLDTNNSHAPEELVPGRIYDTLEMRVFTNTVAPLPLGFRLFYSMNCNTVDSNLNPQPTVQLVNDMADTDTSCEVILHENNALLLPTITYSPTIVINGEYMTYTGFNSTTNIISGITRGANAKDHRAGSFITVLDNLKDYRYYYRISNLNTTTLARSLDYDDTDILVTDASNLIQPYAPDNIPGVIFINGERIVYWVINFETNRLSQLVRGTQGTSVPATHQIGSLVSDASQNQVIEDADAKIWLNPGALTPADGGGLYTSTTTQADFLRQESSYIPS